MTRLVVAFAALLALGTQAQAATFVVPGMTVNVGDQGLLSGPYDLTQESLVIKAQVDLTGLDDLFHTIFKLGITDTNAPDYYMLAEGHGVWLATDHQWWKPGDFDPDPVGAPTLDIDDKLILQRDSLNWNDESAYNLPGVPPVPGNNHHIWFDRDGVDPWQALSPLAIDGATYNTGGIYDIELHLTATGATTGTAFLKVNGLWQGFETDGNWNTIELFPAGMTFTGDMTGMNVFYAVKGWCFDGQTLEEAIASGCNTSTVTTPEPGSMLLFGAGLLGVATLARRRLRR